METNEIKIREEILKKVEEIYKIREANNKFIEGKSKIHYAGRVYDEKEMKALIDSALDFWLTLGENDKKFIEKFKSYMGMKYGIVANSGSSANLIAVSTLCSPMVEGHLKSGDEVITTALTFPTTLSPIVINNLVPVFVDCEVGTYNLDPFLIEKAITPKTRAIMFAHTLGNPADMDTIMDIAKKHNLFVIEDTCDALDSKYDNKLCGTFGDFSTYSFYAAHHITMGEGGAVLTNNKNLYRQALSIRDWGRACYCQTGEKNAKGACGKRFEHDYELLPKGYDHKYVYSNIGYNLKPLDIQCAIGIEQLDKLPYFTEKRKKNFEILYKIFSKYSDYFILPRSLKKAEASWFAFPITIKKDKKISRWEIVKHFEANNIETRMLFAGNILKQPAYNNIKYKLGSNLDKTNYVMENTFFIGVYPALNEQHFKYIEKVLDDYMNNIK